MGSKSKKCKKQQLEIFPWEDVRASKKIWKKQIPDAISEAKGRYLAEANGCPCCEKQADNLTWQYFRSPKWTWEQLCGRAGYLTICENCSRQVEFFCEIMN